MAAATTWHPKTQFSPKSWLLSDGTIVQEPPLEETASGRKVRIAGTSVSAFSKDIDNLIWQGVQMIAKDKGVLPWMALDAQALKEQEEALYGRRLRPGKRPDLHLLSNRSMYGEEFSTIWFRFKHATLPVEATLVVDLRTHRWGTRRSDDVTLNVVLLQPQTSPDHADKPVLVQVGDNEFDALRRAQRDHTKRQAVTDLVTRNKPAWLDDVSLTMQSFNNSRHAVKAMRDAIREIDALQTISILDLRDADKPDWLELDLYDTNLTGEFQQSLADFLDGSGVVAEIKSHYDEIKRLFRASGIVVEDLSENDWARALAGGEPVTVQVESPPDEEGGGKDHEHSVTLHLPTGTIVVNCNKRAASKDQIAVKWDEAQTLASLTGQEDALLAYARRYAEVEAQERAKRIVKERTVSDK